METKYEYRDWRWRSKTEIDDGHLRCRKRYSVSGTTETGDFHPKRLGESSQDTDFPSTAHIAHQWQVQSQDEVVGNKTKKIQRRYFHTMRLD